MHKIFGSFDFNKFFLLLRMRFLILIRIAVFFLFFFGFHHASMDPSGEETSTGNQVPSVSAVRQIPSNSKHEFDKDITCPICFQTMKDAFSTSCGHSFCYMCITTHLNNRKNCPCCGMYLTSTQVFPNFLLTKVMRSFSLSFFFPFVSIIFGESLY